LSKSLNSLLYTASPESRTSPTLNDDDEVVYGLEPLLSLEERRIRADLIELFKMIKGFSSTPNIFKEG